MVRSPILSGLLVALALGHCVRPALAVGGSDANRVAVAMDDKTFVTIKDHADWENLRLYKIENGRILLVDSVSVRHEPQVDRIVEFRRIPIQNAVE